LIEDCRFFDFEAFKAEGWRACVEGGKVGSEAIVSRTNFVCRGAAVKTRSAGASNNFVAVIDCRGISPSANTAVGAIFLPTYIYCVETYNVAAVNKTGVVTTTTSDLRMKTGVTYL